MRRSIATGILLLFGLVAEPAAAVLPSGFSESLVASGISNPTAMAFAPDGRLFVCQQGGQLRVIKDGTLLPAPFVSLTVNASGERGLLGVAFDPNFAVNHFVYVYYTATTPAIHNRVSRFTANGDVAVPGSETIILELETLSSATNHNGGALHFDADGTLLIAVGDNANGANSQTLANRKGKMLRINANGSIPTNNPFYLQATGVNRSIWALGLRNPFTFDIRNGRMFINDVGQNTYEEINDGIAGSNYGWPESEGPTTNPEHRAPLFHYDHSAGGCAITGGAFYVPDVGQFPGTYLGKYFFADYCAGWIRVFDPSAGTASGFATGISAPVDLKVGPEGSLYYIARGTGAVWKISYTASQAPQITAASCEPDRDRGSVGHLHRGRDRVSTVVVSLAAEQSRHSRRHLDQLHHCRGHARRRWRDVPRGGDESFWYCHQQRGAAGRDAGREFAAGGHHHAARDRHAVHGRHDDQLRGNRHRQPGRHAAAERVHLADRFPSRHPHASVHAARRVARRAGASRFRGPARRLQTSGTASF